MDIEAFILVGGRSSRFGQDKAAISFGGKSLVERTALNIDDALSPLRITLVAANAEQFVTVLGLQRDLPFIFDLYENRGPFGAVHAALCYAQADWAAVLACDLPLISSRLLQRLAGFVLDETDAIAPIQPDGRPQPLCALYRVKPCLKVTEDILNQNRPTPPLKTILDKVRTRFVQFDEVSDLQGSNNFFLNMNTPEDFQAAADILRAEK